MEEVLLLKLGEMVLKGLNRKTFDQALLRNIKRWIGTKSDFDVRYAQSTVYIRPLQNGDLDDAEENIRKVFGVISYSRACVTEKNIEEIAKAAEQYLAEELCSVRSFKVESKRADKSFPFTSPEISSEVGGRILDRYPHLHVDVHNPEVIVRVEVRDFGAYVYGSPKPGPGGIPVGTGGKAAILISGGIDSPVAAWMMARRGVELTAIHFASPPYTSPRAEQKVVNLLEKVSEYAGYMDMYTVEFAQAQEAIMQNCPEELFTVIMRRFMVRVAEAVARQNGCDALITGESLGQVASQTMQALVCTDAVATMPVFRPLIGMDKAEIVKISREIDTFAISIEPYEDCCTIFTPRHPRTRPTTNVIDAAEAKLDITEIVNQCLQHVRLTRIRRKRK